MAETLDNILYHELVAFNKRPVESFKNGTKITGPKMLGNIGLLITSMSYNLKHTIQSVSSEQPELNEDEFWERFSKAMTYGDLKNMKKHISNLRDTFSSYTAEALFEAITTLYLKSGNVHNRKLLNQKPNETVSEPVTNTIYCWQENDSSFAYSNFVFYLRLKNFSGNVYEIETPVDLDFLINLIEFSNKNNIASG